MTFCVRISSMRLEEILLIVRRSFYFWARCLARIKAPSRLLDDAQAFGAGDPGFKSPRARHILHALATRLECQLLGANKVGASQMGVPRHATLHNVFYGHAQQSFYSIRIQKIECDKE